MADQHKVALAGIGLTALAAIAGLGVAMTGYINPDLGWVLFVVGVGGAVLVFVRTWLPDVLPLRPFWRISRAASARSTQPRLTPSPVGEILEDLRAKFGPDSARTIVAEAAIERNKPNSPSSLGTSAAPHVVRERIRRALDHPRGALGLLEDKEFAQLMEKADCRTAEEQTEAFQVFGKMALKLAEKLEQGKAQEEMRDRDWQAITTLHGQAKSALAEVPLDKHREYAKDLSKIQNILDRREHPRSGQNPFTIKDLRDRLARDGVR